MDSIAVVSGPEANDAGDTVRPLRADARRNRERVLVAATAVFAEDGLEASVADIARRAGVGVGTLFRHFPTKRELLLATLELGFDDVRAAMDRAEEMEDGWEGVVHVFTVCAEIQSRDRAFLEAVGPELFNEPSMQLRNVERMALMKILIERAQAAGLVREDLRAEDVPFLLSAIGGATGQCGQEAVPDLWRRYLGIVLDGIRPAGASPLPVAAPTLEQLTARCRMAEAAAGKLAPQ